MEKSPIIRMMYRPLKNVAQICDIDTGMKPSDETNSQYNVTEIIFSPHYWNVSSFDFSLSAPSTRQTDSLPSRGQGHQTSQQTGRGT